MHKEENEDTGNGKAEFGAGAGAETETPHSATSCFFVCRFRVDITILKKPAGYGF